MKSNDKLVTVLLFIGLFISECHSILKLLWPITDKITYNVWGNRYIERITVSFYMFEIESFICWGLWFLAFSITAISPRSPRLQRVIFVFILYFMTQIGFYIYDRNTSFIRNIIVYICMVIAIILIFRKDKNGKIINF